MRGVCFYELSGIFPQYIEVMWISQHEMWVYGNVLTNTIVWLYEYLSWHTLRGGPRSGSRQFYRQFDSRITSPFVASPQECSMDLVSIITIIIIIIIINNNININISGLPIYLSMAQDEIIRIFFYIHSGYSSFLSYVEGRY